MGSQQHVLRLRNAAATTESAMKPGARFRDRVIRYLFLTISITLVAVVAQRAWPEVRAAFGVMRTVTPWMIVVAMLLEAVAVAALAQVYRASLNSVSADVTYRQALQVSMGAFTLSRVLPGGGAAGAVWASRRLRRIGVPWAVAGTAVVLEGVLAMATLGLIVTAGTLMALFRGHVSAGSVVAACVVAGLFAAAGWAALALLRSAAAREAMFRRVERLLPRFRDRLHAWRGALDDLADTLPNFRALVPIMGWSGVNWVLEIAALWTVFAGLGPHMEFGVLIVGYGVANLVTALPHTPGGLGLVEAGMTGTYVALGTETSVALAAVLAYRLIAFWLPVLFGVPQYLRAPVAGDEDAS